MSIVTKTPAVGFRAEAFEGRNLVVFLLIAFGWTWSWWALYVFDVLSWPAGVGTDEVEVSPMLFLLAITPFGPTIAGFVTTAISEGSSRRSKPLGTLLEP